MSLLNSSLQAEWVARVKHISWEESLDVDIEEINDDHKKLVDLFNLLSQAVENGDSVDYVDAVLEELITCTIWHFRHEERLMLRYRYDGMELHKAEHTDLIEGVRAMQQMLREENRLPTSEDFEYLAVWLTRHIVGQDMRLGFYLAEVME
ncbi:MAG: hemerythrin family protein [Thiotrichales bacterium]|nr:MAG: hemerythrin family protein [Thiotrichales bacterium]